MFKVGDIVKLKPGCTIDTQGFYNMQNVIDFLRINKYYYVHNILEDGQIGLTTENGIYDCVYPSYYFKPDNFEIHKSASQIKAERPYSELTKLEYAAIKIFAARDWDMSDQYRKNVIVSAKKLLEECND